MELHGEIQKQGIELQAELVKESEALGGAVMAVGRPGKSPYIGENGNWFVFDDVNRKWVDTGVVAEGYSPVKGEDYFTETDKAEIVDDVVVEITDITDEQADLIAQVEETLAGKSLPAASSDSGVFAYMEKGTFVDVNALCGGELWIDSGRRHPDPKWDDGELELGCHPNHYTTRIRLVGLENYKGENLTLEFLRRKRNKGWGSLMTFHDIEFNQHPMYGAIPDYIPKELGTIYITDQNIDDGYIDVDLYTYLVPCVKPLTDLGNDQLEFQCITFEDSLSAHLLDDNVDLVGRYRKKAGRHSSLKLSCVIKKGDTILGFSRNNIALVPTLSENRTRFVIVVDDNRENVYICGMHSFYN